MRLKQQVLLSVSGALTLALFIVLSHSSTSNHGVYTNGIKRSDIRQHTETMQNGIASRLESLFYSVSNLDRKIQSLDRTLSTMSKNYKSNSLKTTQGNEPPKSLKTITKTIKPSNHRKVVVCLKTHIPASRYVILDGVKAPCSLRYFLVIVVSTHAKNRDRRNQIRQTWGDHTKWGVPDHLPWTVVFNVGFDGQVPSTSNITNNIRDEFKAYGDMIIGNVTESFYTLSRKLSISTDWVHRNLVYDFFLKTDDDVFINVPKIIHNLQKLPNYIEYFGHVMWRQRVERSGRYKLTPEEFKNNNFDPYCSGGGFIARQGLISKVAPFLAFENPLKYEDAYFGSLVYLVGKVPSWDYRKSFMMFNKKCEYHNDVWVSHPAKTSDCMGNLLKQAMMEKYEF